MKKLVGSARRKPQKIRGAAAVELALLLPLLLILLAGFVDLGRLSYQHNILNKAVRETGRYLSTQGAGNQLDVGLGGNKIASHSQARNMVVEYAKQLGCEEKNSCLKLEIEEAIIKTTSNCGKESCQAPAVGAGTLRNIGFTGGTYNFVKVTLSEYEMKTYMLGYALALTGIAESTLLVPTVSATFVQE